MDFIRQKYQFSRVIQQELISLRQLDNWHCLFGIFYDYLVIAAAVFIFYLQPWCYPISLILIGSRQRALATLLHESAHLCLAKSRRLNQFVGTFLSGYLIFQEFNTYRDSHVKRHHAFLGDPNKDPDYQYHLKENLYEYSNGVNFVKQFIVKPLLLSKTMSYFWYLVRYRLIPSRRYLKNFIEIFLLWGAIITFCYYFHLLTYLLLLWFVPLVTTAVVFGWFNELAEHYPLIKFNDNDLYMTRNRFSHWFEHFLFNTHNENYHLVHHLQASIPYWNLKKAHAVMCQDPNYASFNQSMGGIFISNNHNPSLIKLFLMGPMTFASKQEAIS